MAEQTPSLDITIRACRYSSRVQTWKSLPAEAFVSYEEPGVCLGTEPKEIRVAETQTTLKDEDESEAIRSVVCPMGDLAKQLPSDYLGAHVKTVRRTFFNRPGQPCFTPTALIVYLDPFRKQEALMPVIDQINSEQHRIPWLNNRQLVISLTSESRAGP